MNRAAAGQDAGATFSINTPLDFRFTHVSFSGVSKFLAALVSVLVAANLPAAVSNLVTQTTGTSVKVPDPNDPVEKEFKKLMESDDAAEAEVDGWIVENQKFAAQGVGIPRDELRERIRKRLGVVREAYQDFIKRHPDHARARVAFSGLLEDLGDEDAELEQLEKALQLDPKIPSVYNQLANHYGHNGGVKKAFEYYAKAIELDPTESVYYQNFATTVYLYRTDAKEYYHINEQQVFDKALDLYAQAMKADPTNFSLAMDLAESYYPIRPLRTNDTLKAFTNALNVASNQLEREAVYIHFARFNYIFNRLPEARGWLTSVTNEAFAKTKAKIASNILDRERELAGTNAPPAAPSTNAPAKK